MKLGMLFLLCLPLLAESKSLDLSQGHFVAGGAASTALLLDKNDNAGWRFDLRPSFGFFALDRFSIEGNAKLLIDPVQGAETNVWGAGILFRYYFKLHDILFPYVGFGGDAEWISKEFRGASVQFPIGLLIGLNETVAIDIGLPIRLFIPNYDKGLVLVELPIGYYGLKAVF